MRLIVLCVMLYLPQRVFGADHNAYHVFGQDNLWGWGDTHDIGSATTYTPDLNGNVPLNSELDEFYLRITFNPGITPSISLLYDVSYGNELHCAPGGYAMKSAVSGQNLYVWYGFQDGHTPAVIASESDWTFQVAGSDPVASVDFFVSYHGRTSGAMPDLDPNYQNLRVLSADQLPLIQAETPQTPMSFGSDFSSVATGKKVIVLLHGWNPDGNVNHYGDLATWQTIEGNLLACPVVLAQGWVVTRYDWARDASTGPNSLSSELIANANASRDAASAHGLKLGKALGAKSPSQVLFIAHSAGNWAAKRAAAYLKWKNPAIKIQITSLDPFVNDGDGTLGDMDLTASFQLMSQWTDRVAPE